MANGEDFVFLRDLDLRNAFLGYHEMQIFNILA